MLRTSARISALRTSAGALGVRGLSCGPLAASLRTGCAYGRTLRTGSLHSLPLAAASSVSSSFSGASGLPLFRRHYDALLATQVRAFSAAAAAAPPPPPPAASAPSDSNSSSSKDGEKNDNNAPVVSSTTQSSEPVVVDDGIISAGEGHALEPVKQDRWTKIKEKVKKELHHYWTGTKLLVYETKISSKLLWRLVVNGEQLTRRERRQLTRTAADLLRLIPFAVIVIVPFLEFALPVLIKLFPNLLPSTFDDAEKKEAIRKAQLRIKIEMAQFLHETTMLMAQQLMQKKAAAMAATGATDEDRMSVEEFNVMMYKIKQGIHVTNDEIVKYARFFQDELTLEALSRQQLVAMCKLLDLATWGTSAGLRRAIKKKVKELKEDDKLIAAEGVDTLTEAELKEACRARGINPERSPDQLRRKLTEWLDLSLYKDIPVTILVLSRAFSSAMRITDDAIKDTLSQLPATLVDEAKEQIADMEPEESPAKKLQKLKDEERAIQEEKEAAKKEAEAAAAAAAAPKAAAEKPAAPKTAKELEEELQQMLEELKEVKEDITETKEVVQELKEDLEELERELEKKEKEKAKQKQLKAAEAAAAAAEEQAKEVTEAAKAAVEAAKVDIDVEPDDAKALDKLTKKVENMVAKIEKELSSESKKVTV